MYISDIVGYIWGAATVLWDVTPCILLQIYVRLGGTTRLHLQGRWHTSQKARIDQAATASQTHAFCFVKNEAECDYV